MNERLLSVRGGDFEVELLEAGSGPAALYLHGIWDAKNPAFVEELARTHHVLSPRLPGFGRSNGEERLLDIHDAIYYFLDVLDTLEIDRVPLIGHCLGGMFAAELAAVDPKRFTSVTLIAPFGLWNQAHPVPDFFAMSPAEIAKALYGKDMAGESPALGASQAPNAAPDSDEARVNAAVERARFMAAAARFLWPLPNRGLARRIHRVSEPTLLVWGEEDGIVPPEYGRDFQALIKQARLETLPAGHLVHCQEPKRVAEMVRSA